MIAFVPPLAGFLCAALQPSAPGPSNAASSPPAMTSAQVEEGVFGPTETQFIVNIQASFTYANNSDVDRNQFSLSSGVGYFLSREHEFGANVFVQYQKVALDAGGGATAQTYALLPYYNYNYYVSPRLALYGGPHIEVYYFDDGSISETDFGYGFQVGTRYWVSPSVSLSLEPRYTHRDLSEQSGKYEDEVVVLFGLNFVL